MTSSPPKSASFHPYFESYFFADFYAGCTKEFRGIVPPAVDLATGSGAVNLLIGHDGSLFPRRALEQSSEGAVNNETVADAADVLYLIDHDHGGVRPLLRAAK